MNLEQWQERRKYTLISVRRALTEPKTTLAGAIDETFSARLVSWMAAFNRWHPPVPQVVGNQSPWSELKVAAREPCGVKAMRKILKMMSARLPRDASCK